MKIQQKEKGFTIIEVVLVLAIAGLIFLMVFIALPALQRSQRDTQRKNDLSRMVTALNSYQSNNRGSIPTTVAAWGTFVTNYLRVSGDTFTDPNGTDYIVSTTQALPAQFTAASPVIRVTTGSTCSSTEGLLTAGAGARKVAFQMRLEGNGIACENN
jgi:prepilin-type N-terminal cleavage/methylation domain-containing protein